MTARDGSTARRLARAAAGLCLALSGVAYPQGNPVPDGEIVFGMCAPFSGAEKELGRRLRLGWEIAFAEQNAGGGVHGRRLRLAPIDDGHDPARTMTAMRQLVEGQRVLGIVGSFGTATAAVAVPYASERSVLFFGAHSGARLLRNDPPDRYVFNVRASHEEEAEALVRHLVEARRIPPGAIALFAQDDADGDSAHRAVAKALRRHGHDPRETIRVGYRRGTIQVEAAVRRIRQGAPQVRAVIVFATPKPAARLIGALRDARLVFAVASTAADELAVELEGRGPRGEDLVMTQVVPPPTSRATAILRYQEVLRKLAPGEEAGFLSLESYLSARVLIEGLQRAGRTLTVDRLVDALEGIRGIDLGIGTPITFGPSEHQGSHRVWGTVLDGSGFRAFDLE